jgi:hypothetical protein
MSPVANSFNTLGANNQQPEYQMLWEPMAIYPSSAITAITIPSAAGAGAWVAGAALQYGASGTTITAAGTNWPTGTSTSPSGDDYGGLSSPYTIQTVDIAAVSTTTYFAGVLLGVGSLGANSPVAPNTITGRLPAQIAMVGKRGICQVLMDTTAALGDTFKVSATATHTGQFADSGGTTFTAGTTCGVILQAVTVSTGPLLCWVKLNAY